MAEAPSLPPAPSMPWSPAAALGVLAALAALDLAFADGSLARDGMLRAADLGLILAAACLLGRPAPRLAAGSPARAMALGASAALALGALACITEAALALLPSSWGGPSLFRALLGDGPDPALSAHSPEGAAAAYLLVGVLLGPAAEEAYFRGVLQPALSGRSRALGVAGSALVFAVVHAAANPGSVPVAQLVGGILFGVLAVRTGGVLAGWVAHACANGFILFLNLTAPGAF